MNWVGGARSRIRQQPDRRRQREFFEQKRLQAKVTKIRPKSPQDGARRGISTDLLFLQAVSKAHDGSRDDGSEHLYHVKKLKLTGPRAHWPERNLALPMSPIGKPSVLDLHDSICNADLLPLLPPYSNAPKVSTQKLPHHTALDSFGPPPLQQSTGFPKSREVPNQSMENTSLWTESIISHKRRIPPNAMPTSTQFGQSLLSRESVASERKKSEGQKYDQKPAADHPLFRDRAPKRYIELPDRDTKRKKLVAEKSYDHETPFNFGDYAASQVKERKGKELPSTKASLLDFHISENPSKPEDRWQAKNTGMEQPPRERAKPFVWHLDQAEPAAGGAEPREDANHWEPLSKESTNTSFFSSMFDENPLSKKDGPISCTTVFNESILGPIQKHNNRKGKPLSNEAMAAVPEPSERGTVGDSQGGCGASGMQSAFEKMMNTFGAFEKTIEKPAQPQSSVNKEGLVKGVLPQGLCDSSEVMVLGRRGGRMEGESRGGYGGQDRKWQDFTSGFTKELHQDTQHDTAVHKEWQQFINEPSGALGSKPAASSDTRRAEGDHTGQEYTVSEENSSCGLKPHSVPVERRARRRLGNISVVDELMCLEEIDFSTHGSDAVMASQEISFTPMVGSRQVPDVDAGISSLRCMSENPLNICHLPPQPSPSGESLDTCGGSQESESVVVATDQTLSDHAPAAMCEDGRDSKQDCVHDQETTDKSCSAENEHSEFHSEADKVHVVQTGDDLMCTETMFSDMSKESQSEQECSTGEKTSRSGVHYEEADCSPICTAVGNCQLEESTPCQPQTVDVACGSDAAPVNPIPAEFQDAAVQPSPILCSSATTQTEIEDDSSVKESKTKFVSVGVQCLSDKTSKQTQTNSSLMLMDKSIQTNNAPCEDKGVQAMEYTDTVHQDRVTGTERDSTEQLDGKTAQLMESEKRSSELLQVTKDQVVAMKKELDSMQNTIIWQSLMLKLYEMH